jgi:nucleoside-diphosphate-sugar epimerase
MNIVCVNNVVAAIKLLMLTDEKINGEVFIVSDDESPYNNYRYVERYMMHSLGLSGYQFPVVPAPHFALGMLLRFAKRSNINPRRIYSCQKLLSIGLKKDVSFENGLADFADWYKKHI